MVGDVLHCLVPEDTLLRKREIEEYFRSLHILQPLAYREKTSGIPEITPESAEKISIRTQDGIDSPALVSETLLGLAPIPTDTGSGRVYFREIIRAFTIVFVGGRTGLA